MSCSQITQGIQRGCNNNLGGIRNIYISTNPITSYLLNANGVIIRFFGYASWLTIEADQGTGNFLETYEINQSGSIVAFKQSVTFQINDLSAYNQQRIQELAESTNLGVVVEMNNGKFFTVGVDRGAYLETGSTGSGTGYGDLSGSTITITGMEQISSLEVLPIAAGQSSNTLAYSTYRLLTPCNQLPVTFEDNFRLAATAEDVKCVWDTQSAYLVSDPEGCNPTQNNVQNSGFFMYWTKGESVGVGTLVYNFLGQPFIDGWFWYYPTGSPVQSTGAGGFENNPNMYIAQSTSGVITYFEPQQNVTC